MRIALALLKQAPSFVYRFETRALAKSGDPRLYCDSIRRAVKKFDDGVITDGQYASLVQDIERAMTAAMRQQPKPK